MENNTEILIEKRRKYRRQADELIKTNDNCKDSAKSLNDEWKEYQELEKNFIDLYHLPEEEGRKIRKIHNSLVEKLSGVLIGTPEAILAIMIEGYSIVCDDEPTINYYQCCYLDGKYYIRIVINNILYRILQPTMGGFLHSK